MKMQSTQPDQGMTEALARDLCDQPLSDSGNAQRLAILFADRLLCAHPIGWHSWRGTHWEPDQDGETVRLAIRSARALAAAADRIAGDDPARLKVYKKFALQSENNKNLQSCLSVASKLRVFTCLSTALDKDPWLFNCTTATIDLRHDGNPKPHAPADRITRCAPATLEGPATFPAREDSRWHSFLEQILPDTETRLYVQRAIGQSLIGAQREHAIFICYGTGQNGKGTFFRAIQRAIGGYYTPLPTDSVIKGKQAAHPAWLADLAGKRIAVTSELPREAHLDEAKLKYLTGADRQKARFMGKDFFEFDPSHSLWICTNDLPPIEGNDKGMWRRLKLIPFTAKIDKPDTTLDDVLATELDHVLTWAIEGTTAYMREGLTMPDQVAEATACYRSDQDDMGTMLAECCEVGPGFSMAKAQLRAVSEKWFTLQKLAPPSDVALHSAALALQGVSSGRVGGNGPRVWIGMRLVQNILQDLTEAAARESAGRRGNGWQMPSNYVGD